MKRQSVEKDQRWERLPIAGNDSKQLVALYSRAQKKIMFAMNK